MGLYLGGLIIGRIFASEIWRAYFWEGLFWGRGGLIIGILRYIPSFVWFSRTEKTLGSSLLRACEILCEIKPCVHLERAAKKTVVNSTKQK